MAALPEDFAALTRYVPDWAIGTEAARNRKRLASPLDELQALYNAMLPRMEDAIAHLKGHPLDALPEPEQDLLNLALMFMEVAPAVEIFKHPDVPWGFVAERFEILPG
jgi:hypothetical protein